jgi:NAD(P)-dependent dehydrogenase (short-subunit alcohol dehydrogenase family)
MTAAIHERGMILPRKKRILLSIPGTYMLLPAKTRSIAFRATHSNGFVVTVPQKPCASIPWIAFLLTYKLLPALIKAKGCVIMTGSGSHRGIKVHWDDIMLNRRYNPLIAYKQSKLCNLLFAKGLNDRYAKDGIRAYVVDPGLVNTDIGNKGTGGLVNFVWSLRKKHGVSPDVPAKTYAFLCEQKDRQNGLYYYLCKEIYYSKEVTSENANRLFELSERLCGIRYEGKEMVAV